MTSTRLADGRMLHLPAPEAFADSAGAIATLPDDALPGLAALVREEELLLFTRRLIDGARKRRFNSRYRDVNRSRLLFARLCIDRALGVLAAKASAASRG